jgi:hypothetical protein
MAPTDFFTDAPLLSQEDQRLVDTYLRIGRPIDDLAYSDDFDRLFDEYKMGGSTLSKYDVYRRLLALRKIARLPRIYGSSRPAP